MSSFCRGCENVPRYCYAAGSLSDLSQEVLFRPHDPPGPADAVAAEADDHPAHLSLHEYVSTKFGHLQLHPKVKAEIQHLSDRIRHATEHVEKLAAGREDLWERIRVKRCRSNPEAFDTQNMDLFLKRFLRGNDGGFGR